MGDRGAQSDAQTFMLGFSFCQGEQQRALHPHFDMFAVACRLQSLAAPYLPCASLRFVSLLVGSWSGRCLSGVI